MPVDGVLVFFLEIMQDIADAQSVPADLIRIGRANALAGRADFAASLGRFVSRIQKTVCRQNQMRLFGNIEPVGQFMPCGFERFRLGLEQGRVKHHAVTDDIYLVALENPGRNGTQHKLVVFKLQRMSCIRAALKTANQFIFRCQNIDNLAFAFISPLEPKQYIYLFHSIFC